MTYDKAEPAFRAAAEADPECALAWWGPAMSWVHPLWPDTVSAAQREAGVELLAKAAAAAHSSPREAAYVAALAGYYEGAGRSERQRLVSFLEGSAAVHAEYPEDVEAAAFHALALFANAPAEDKSCARQMAAGEILEGITARLPHHPGAHHYTIHAWVAELGHARKSAAVGG